MRFLVALAIYLGLLGVPVFFQARLLAESLALAAKTKWSVRKDAFKVFAFLFFLIMELLLLLPLATRLRRLWEVVFVMIVLLLVLLGLAAFVARVVYRRPDGQLSGFKAPLLGPTGRRILAAISCLMGLVAVGAYVSTFGHAVPNKTWVPFILINVAFWFIALLLGRTEHDPFLTILIPRKVPRWFPAVEKSMFAFAFLNFALLMLFGATPIREANRFMKKTISGHYQIVSEAEYRRIQGYETRTFAAFWAVLNMYLGLTLWLKDCQPPRGRAALKPILGAKR